ncbi:MAG TPA: helical backbone metal receptor [Mycobacteriales bacterium]|jgi:ABC-type Fe3+-hydroxamate transport system substrate-binding protein
MPAYASRASDDLGHPVAVPRPVRRVVSLVPSLTEAVAFSGLLVGATDYCVEPAGLDVARVGGSKYPSVPAVLDLAPDLVLANFEENREADVAALRAAGVAVWVTAPTTVPAALTSLGRLLAVLGAGSPPWYAAACRAWPAGPPPPVRARAVVPIWRKPWMALGRDTFAGDVLARLGVANVLASSPSRYPEFAPDDLPPYDLVVLPDEPYAFGPEDAAAFPGARAAFVSGRHLTWYGPSLAEARDVLERSLFGPA